MREYLEAFFEKFDYSWDAQEALFAAYDAIDACPEAQERFRALLRQYADDIGCDMDRMIAEAGELAGQVGAHEYTVKLLLFLCLSRSLRFYYLEEGLDAEIWYACMRDLKYKAIECKLVKGVWGSFVSSWFIGFFKMTRFAFGKLQFELIPLGADYAKNGWNLTSESRVVNVHIPRTGGRLDEANLRFSYAQAAAFFKKRYGLEQIAFVCSSWLLFPRNLEVLSAQSNLRAFISDYDLIAQGEYADYAEVWRLFDQDYEGDVEKLPQDTSFRRAYADWIRRGLKTGWGRGVYPYEE